MCFTALCHFFILNYCHFSIWPKKITKKLRDRTTTNWTSGRFLYSLQSSPSGRGRETVSIHFVRCHFHVKMPSYFLSGFTELQRATLIRADTNLGQKSRGSFVFFWCRCLIHRVNLQYFCFVFAKGQGSFVAHGVAFYFDGWWVGLDLSHDRAEQNENEHEWMSRFHFRWAFFFNGREK